MYLKVSKKYRAKELLNKLPASDRDIAMKQLPKYLGVSRNTFSKILNVNTNDSYEPAAGTLIKLASFLNITTEELLEVKPQSITIDQLRVLSSANTAKDLSLSK
jgi:transcriptional regulator with XRE-family HTH domain